jgi:hypothetical protein
MIARDFDSGVKYGWSEGHPSTRGNIGKVIPGITGPDRPERCK